MKSGIVVINKGEGITSQGVVNKVKKLFGEKKAGHTGTLDPLATGVLPVLIGRGVKASEYMLSSDKHYRAELLLGKTSDTEDITGNILTECDDIPDENAVLEAISSFIGENMQTPPMYSALKIGGEKLCDLARRGVTIEREARKITIHSIEAKKISERLYSLDVHCSKGTYIRTLCADIGNRLGCGGLMNALMRTKASCFTLSDAVTLEELERMTEAERDEKIIPTETVFENCEKVVLDDFYSRLARCGVEIYLKKIGRFIECGKRVTLFDKTGFFALGEVREFDTGMAIKPIKQFDV